MCCRLRGVSGRGNQLFLLLYFVFGLAWELLLALRLEITPGQALWTLEDARDQTLVGRIQGKSPPCCAVLDRMLVNFIKKLIESSCWRLHPIELGGCSCLCLGATLPLVLSGSEGAGLEFWLAASRVSTFPNTPPSHTTYNSLLHLITRPGRVV